MARANAPWFRKSANAWYTTLADGKKVSLGVQGKANEKEATKAWHRLMADGKAVKSLPDAIVSVHAVLDAFLDDCIGRTKAHTIRVYRYLLKAFCKEHGKAKANTLTTTLCENFARKQGWAETSQNAFLGALATAFHWAVKAKLLAANPIVGLKRPPKRSRGADTVLTLDEHERLLEHATPCFRPFLVVLHATGGRPGEVASITAENFDEANALVVLSEHKNAHKGKSRVLYLTPAIVTLLAKQRMKFPEGVLLRNNYGKRWTGNALVKAMIATRRRAGIDHAICYGERHSFATDALVNGVPDAHVAELLGHAGTAMLHKHYAHLGARAKVLKDALGKVR
jgi:integrase